MKLRQDKLEEARRIATDPDYVRWPRCGHSLSRVLLRYPDGLTDAQIADALGITEEEVSDHYQAIIVKLQEILGEKE